MGSAPLVQPPFGAYRETSSGAFLRGLMQRHYTVAQLQNETPAAFQRHILGMIGQHDAAIEGYGDATCQRDFSVQFAWGHDHDFGAFTLSGAMRSRHIDILATCMEAYGVPDRDLRGTRILDVGCWTGGTSLLLAAMGADVFAIEEVRKYAECVNYLKHAFGIDNLTVEHRSLYSLADAGLDDAFDIVLYAGVLYHVTDPVLSLRIVFNTLKDEGVCLLETMAIGDAGSVCRYDGAFHTLARPWDGTPRYGWQWFVPSLAALSAMMADVGFAVRRATLHEGVPSDERRALALGVRQRHGDMLRAGLARPDIR